MSGNPIDPFTGQASGFACDAHQPTTQTCARHFSVGQGTSLTTASNTPPQCSFAAKLVSWDGPCTGIGIGPGPNRCDFTLSADTCITATFGNPQECSGATPQPLSGPSCPSGPAGQ